MSEPFDAFDFGSYLKRNWRMPVSAILAAILLALAIGLFMPKRYTATASIMIEPPGMSDTRTATAVSPIYLESLKSYERVASSDTLFARAVGRFHLQEAPETPPIESLKRRVLKVAKLRDTKILEISITLANPVLAQNCAQFLAEETVRLTREESAAADQEMVDVASRQFALAQERLDASRKSAADSARTESAEALQGEIDTDLELLSKLKSELSDNSGDVSGAPVKSRLEAINRQIAEVKQEFSSKSAALSDKMARRQEAQSDLDSAQSVYSAALTRLNDLRAASGTRGERLRIIDPGIVPQRPSAPNIPLNLLVAFAVAVIAAVSYSALGFAHERRDLNRLSHSMTSRR